MDADALQFDHGEEHFATEDNLHLFAQWWRPTGQVKATVVLVHGLAEHSGRYVPVANHLVRNGYAVHTFDLRGHGRSAGRRAFVSSFDNYLRDLDCFLACTRRREPGRPPAGTFLLGHSLGAAIVLLFALIRQPQVGGLVLSGPLLRIGAGVPPWLIRLSTLLSRFLPTLPTTRLDSTAISRNPAVVAGYQRDPLVYHAGIPARTGHELLRAIGCLQAHMADLALPFLILQGGADRLVDPQGSRELYRQAAAADKRLNLYPGLYHEVLNEPEQRQVLSDLVTWLDAHLQPSPI